MGKHTNHHKTDTQHGLTFSPKSGIDAKQLFSFIQQNENLSSDIKKTIKLSDDGSRLDMGNGKVSKEWKETFGLLQSALHNGNWEFTTGQTNLPMGRQGSQLIPDVAQNDQPGKRDLKLDTPTGREMHVGGEWHNYKNMPDLVSTVCGETFAPEGRSPANNAPWLGSEMKQDPPNHARDDGQRGQIAVADRIKGPDGKIVDLTKTKEGQNLIVNTFIHEATIHAGRYEQGKLSGHSYEKKKFTGEKLTPEELNLYDLDFFQITQFKERAHGNTPADIVKTAGKMGEKKEIPNQLKAAEGRDEHEKQGKVEDDAFRNQQNPDSEKKEEHEKPENHKDPAKDKSANDAGTQQITKAEDRAFAMQNEVRTGAANNEAGRDSANQGGQNAQYLQQVQNDQVM